MIIGQEPKIAESSGSFCYFDHCFLVYTKTSLDSVSMQWLPMDSSDYVIVAQVITRQANKPEI